MEKPSAQRLLKLSDEYAASAVEQEAIADRLEKEVKDHRAKAAETRALALEFLKAAEFLEELP